MKHFSRGGDIKLRDSGAYPPLRTRRKRMETLRITAGFAGIATIALLLFVAQLSLDAGMLLA